MYGVRKDKACCFLHIQEVGYATDLPKLAIAANNVYKPIWGEKMYLTVKKDLMIGVITGADGW